MDSDFETVRQALRPARRPASTGAAAWPACTGSSPRRWRPSTASRAGRRSSCGSCCGPKT